MSVADAIVRGEEYIDDQFWSGKIVSADPVTATTTTKNTRDAKEGPATLSIRNGFHALASHIVEKTEEIIRGRRGSSNFRLRREVVGHGQSERMRSQLRADSRVCQQMKDVERYMSCPHFASFRLPSHLRNQVATTALP